MKNLIHGFFLFYVLAANSQTTIELLLPWNTDGDTSVLGLMAVQDYNDTYFILSNIQHFEEGSGIPINGAHTYGSGIHSISSTGELFWQELYLTTLLEWDGLVPAHQLLLNSNDHIVVPFSSAVGVTPCDSVNSPIGIADGFKKGILEIARNTGAVEQAEYFPDDLLCDRDKLLAFQEIQNGYLLLYTDRLENHPLYIETLASDFDLVHVDTFSNDTRWVYLSEYDETILLFSQQTLSILSYDGDVLDSFSLTISDTLISPTVYIAENENYYLFGLTDFTYSQRISHLHVIGKNNGSIQSTMYDNKVIKDVTMTDNDELLILFDLSRNNFYDSMPKPVQIAKLDIDFNELTSKRYGYPYISPNTIDLTNNQAGFMVTGTRLKSIDEIGGREADQIYFLKDEIDQLIVSQSVPAVSNTLSIYPNPSNDVCTISYSLPHFNKGRLTITSISGVKVFSKELIEETAQLKLNLSGYSNGLYLCQILTENGVYRRRILKQ